MAKMELKDFTNDSGLEKLYPFSDPNEARKILLSLFQNKEALKQEKNLTEEEWVAYTMRGLEDKMGTLSAKMDGFDMQLEEDRKALDKGSEEYQNALLKIATQKRPLARDHDTLGAALYSLRKGFDKEKSKVKAKNTHTKVLYGTIGVGLALAGALSGALGYSHFFGSESQSSKDAIAQKINEAKRQYLEELSGPTGKIGDLEAKLKAANETIKANPYDPTVDYGVTYTYGSNPLGFRVHSFRDKAGGVIDIDQDNDAQYNLAAAGSRRNLYNRLVRTGILNQLTAEEREAFRTGEIEVMIEKGRLYTVGEHPADKGAIDLAALGKLRKHYKDGGL